MRSTTKHAVIGTRPIRHDGVDKVTGRAIYGIDVSMPGMLHGKVLRSPHAHARVQRIDVSKALAMDGVHAVITGADMPNPANGLAAPSELGVQYLQDKSASLLARDKVLFDGHGVAAVAASNRHVAAEALDLIEVDYELLTPVLDVRAALEPNAPLLHADLRTDFGGAIDSNPSNVAIRSLVEEGDIARGFADADLVLEREHSTTMVHQGYIEPHSALAYVAPDGRLIVHCSSQGHFGIRNELAGLLVWPISKIKVVPAEIGGGFGGKTTGQMEPLAALLAQKTGRPVKLTMTRAEVLRATGPASGVRTRVKLGVTKAGRITAVEFDLLAEAGAFTAGSTEGGEFALGPYSVDNFRIDAKAILVNKPKTGAYRAPGGPQGQFAMETLVDEVCRELEMDPLEFRQLNASCEGDLRTNGTRFGVVGHKETVSAAQDSDQYRSPIRRSNARLRYGRGTASGFCRNSTGKSSVVARLNPDGTVTLLEGSVDIGGTRTAVAMQAAEVLGIPVNDVDPNVPDTDSIAVTGPTAGSRTAVDTGRAAVVAAHDLQTKMVTGLADYWDVDVADVAVQNGTFSQNGESLSFKAAAAVLDGEGHTPIGAASVGPAEGIAPAFAVHVADVAVDEETGKVDVVRYTAVQDAGTAIYPPYVEGQMEGGVAQGIGWALNEEYIYDAQGHLLNTSLLDYRMPTSLDLPMLECVIVEVPSPDHPFGARGVAEVGIVPPLAAVANAIYDAVGVRIRDLPATPAKVQAAIAAKAVH
jgi:CO/xanthine dehydrogenase Mo-binding subunit